MTLPVRVPPDNGRYPPSTAGAAPISESDHETFSLPSTVLPVEPIVNVLGVVHADAVPEIEPTVSMLVEGLYLKFSLLTSLFRELSLKNTYRDASAVPLPKLVNVTSPYNEVAYNEPAVAPR